MLMNVNFDEIFDKIFDKRFETLRNVEYLDLQDRIRFEDLGERFSMSTYRCDRCGYSREGTVQGFGMKTSVRVMIEVHQVMNRVESQHR